MIAVIYLRVSTEDQVEHGFSLSGQRDECTKKAFSLGATEIIEYTDQGISGSIFERPALQSALARLKVGGVSHFVCLDTSRLSRSVAHQLVILDMIKKAGVEVVFVEARFSNDSPEDRFQLTVRSAVDELERSKLAFRSLLGKRAKAQQGKLTHSPGLYGYKFNIDTDMLSKIPEEARIIDLMYTWLNTESLSCYAIAKRLNSMSVPSPRATSWSKQTVRRILGNESYTGKMTIRKHDATDVKLNKHKKTDKAKRKIRPESEWVSINIPQIIDVSVWDEAQRRLDQAHRHWRSYGKHSYMLSGLIRCGECGSTLHGNLSTSKGNKYPYYTCTAKSPGIEDKQRCTLRNLNADQLDETLWQHISSWIFDASYLDKVLKAALSEEEEGVLAKELGVILSQHSKLIEERGRLLTLYQKGLVPEGEIEARLGSLRGDIAVLGVRKSDLEGQMQRQELAQNEKNMLEALKERVGSRLETLSVSERAMITAMLIDSVTVKHDGIEVKVRAPVVLDGALEISATDNDGCLGRHNPPRGRPQAPGCN